MRRSRLKPPPPPAAAQSPSSSEDSNEDEDKDSKSEEESDSSDDTFVKDSYYSSSSVWRSYTTRGQAKGNKEGEHAAPALRKTMRRVSSAFTEQIQFKFNLSVPLQEVKTVKTG